MSPAPHRRRSRRPGGAPERKARHSEPGGPAFSIALPGVAPRGASPERRALAQTYRRLLDLHEVGRILMRADPHGSACGAVLSILARTLALTDASIVYDAGEGLQGLSVSSRAGTVAALGSDGQRILAAYRYLAGAADQEPGNDTYSRPSSRDLPVPVSTDALERYIVLPLVVRIGQAFGAVQLRGHESLDEVDLVFANMVVTELALALDRQAAADAAQATLATRDRDLRRAERGQRFLADVGIAFVETVSANGSVLATAVELAVPFLADICFADELSEDGSVARCTFGLANASLQDLRTALLELTAGAVARTPQARVAASGKSLLITDISDLVVPEMPGLRELRAVGAHSLMVINLQARGQRFGTLTFVGHASRRAYDAQDLHLAEEMAFRVASGIDHERQMRLSERTLQERQEVLAVVCHELREPLAAVSLGAQVMLQRPSGSDRRQSRKAIEAIQRSVSRMGHLVGDLVDTSSLSGGHLSIRRDWHSLSSIVGEAIEAQAFSSSRKSLALRVELPTEPQPIFCDRHRVLQVLANLLANAIKFTAHEGAIALLVRQDERETTFSVTDNGRGISPADQQHIFDRYWRTHTDNKDGTGLGLYITKGIVEAHGGRIWVASQLHHWSVFSFTIPHGPPPEPSSV